ncbi:MAG TPA: hypothetical protein VMV56_12805 [Williamwhitmania sp.]|nr:hypothetical protein [Williamwhitmania sp.]
MSSAVMPIAQRLKAIRNCRNAINLVTTNSLIPQHHFYDPILTFPSEGKEHANINTEVNIPLPFPVNASTC